jgi:stage II sporulation protein D
MTVLWACVVCILTAAGCRRRPIESTPDIESPEQTWVRVLLFGNLRECTVASVSGFVVEDITNHTLAEFRSEEPVVVRSGDGAVVIGEHVFGSDVLIRPHEPYVFEIDDMSYRGHLRLIAMPGERGVQAINHVPLESYLLGVVGAEMQSYWEPEALKAQSVACRTYCLYTKDRFGQNRQWDLSQTESHQVYRGVTAETTPVKQAVLETAGQVLVCAMTEDGENLIFPTYYSSSCGGHTEAAQHVFGGDAIVSLGGVQCSTCVDVARRSNFYWEPVTMTMSQINEKLMQRYSSLADLERITGFKVTKLGHKSRILRVQLVGQNGKTDWLRGEDFRLSLDPTGRKLKSAIFSIEKRDGSVTFQNGLGFGHGVGMCQCGTQGMARQGISYKQILEYYFPESNIVSIETAHALTGQ